MKSNFFKWGKRAGYITLVVYLCISLLSYGLSVWLRAHMASTPFFQLPSPNGEWILKAYEYQPGGPQDGWDSAGVYLIFDKQGRLQAEIEINRYDFYNTHPDWFGDEILIGDADKDLSVSLPANWWVRFKANLP